MEENTKLSPTWGPALVEVPPLWNKRGEIRAREIRGRFVYFYPCLSALIRDYPCLGLLAENSYLDDFSFFRLFGGIDCKSQDGLSLSWPFGVKAATRLRSCCVPFLGWIYAGYWMMPLRRSYLARVFRARVTDDNVLRTGWLSFHRAVRSQPASRRLPRSSWLLPTSFAKIRPECFKGRLKLVIHNERRSP